MNRITVDQIIEEMKKHRPLVDEELVKKAYIYAEQSHGDQKRKSGEPYFYHPAAVSNILASHGLDEETVATGLLHDVVEDTEITLKDIEKEFGKEISHLVDGVTKLSKVEFKSKDTRQSESFRKMLLAMAQDIRVIIVKLADRLHNMRTLEHMALEKQVAIAQETSDIFAPLAHRLGISTIKNELEDLSFRYLKPSPYQNVVKKLQETRADHDKFIGRIIDLLSEKMKEYDIRCEITGRRKHPYSIFKKMDERKLEFEQIFDVLAFRVVVDSIAKCYEVLGHIHSMWKPIPGRFKDFIAIPKANMYQSLHTTLIGPNGGRIEIQIRTEEMHRIAEEGIAAHWNYKDKTDKQKKEIQQFAWLRQMVEWQRDLKDANEFIETVKIDLFSDEVYVFTPQGEVLDFPRHATPIDYAFRVHTDVGMKCRGAIVNGTMVPLRYELQNGDTVEIITDKNSTPSKDWLKIAVSSKARSKIRAYIKNQEHDSAVVLGKELLLREFKKHHQRLEDWVDSDHFDKDLSDMGLGNLENVFVEVAYGKIKAQSVFARAKKSSENLSGIKKIPKAVHSVARKVLGRNDSSPILVGGIQDIMIRFGKCCQPLTGDSIVGFVTRGRGVTIHKTDCYMIFEMEEDRKVHVAWEKENHSARSVRIKITTKDTQGILAKISHEINEHGGNVENASIKTTADQKAICTFEISIGHIDQLNQLIRSAEAVPGVISVERMKSL